MTKKNRKSPSSPPLPLITLGLVLIIAAAFILLIQNYGAGGSPILKVDKQTIEYGDVKLDTELTFEFNVTNSGDGVLRFKEQPYIEVLEGC